MADSEKGNSTTDSKKKSAALDEDFGKDFLKFWGSSKKEKDNIDFDMEEVPRNKKKSFNFDKLDDFELGGDFDNLPSFKMDMPDLDFSSPVMNAEKPAVKPAEKPIGKHELKNGKFSFNFDFNELDRFDLGSNPVKGNRKPHKPADSNASGYSFKHAWNQNSRSNSGTSTDLFKNMENKKSLNTDRMATSQPDNLMEAAKDSRPSISEDLEHHDESHEVQTSSAKQIAHAEAKKDEVQSKDGHRDHPQETCLTGANVEKTTQDFILQSISGDHSVHEDNPEVQVGSGSSDAVNVDSARESGDSMRTADNSHSRNNSPVSSYNMGCCPQISMTESPNATGDLQKHCNQDQNEVTGGNGVQRQSTQGQKDIQIASFTDYKQNITSRMKNTADKQNSYSKFILSPLQRDSRSVNPKSLNQRVAASLQLNPLSNSTDSTSWKTSSAPKKQADSVHNNKLKTLNLCPASENRESNQNHEQADTWKLGLLESKGEGSNNGTTGISRSERDDVQSDTSSFQLKIPNFQQQNDAANTSTSISHNFVSSIASIRRSKTVPVEMNDASLKDNRTCDSRSTMSSITKLNCKMLNPATPKEAKSVRFSESSLELPLNPASKMTTSVLTEKSGSMNSFLKRMTFEESPADTENLKQLKRAMESTTGRKSFEVSQKVERASVPETKNLETCHNDNYTADLGPNRDAMLRSLTDSEVSRLSEKHRNMEKTKELRGASLLKQITAAEENSKETLNSGGNSEQSKGTYLTISGNRSAQEHLPQFSTNSASLDAAISASAKEQDDNMGTVDSSQSRSTSPVNSYNSRYYQEQSVSKSLNAGGGFQEHHQGNQNEVSERKLVLGESSQSQMEIQNASSTHLSKKVAHGMKNNSDNQNSFAEIIPSPLQRVAKQNLEQAQTLKVSFLKSYENGSTRGMSAISRVQKTDTCHDTSCLQEQNIARNTAKGIIPNSISSIASRKNSKMVHIEMNGSSPNDEKTFDSRLNISSTTKLNSKAQNFAINKEANSGRFSESNSESPLKTASQMANSITEKSASFGAPLKRKTFEDSTDGPKNSNPLKRVMELTIGRKPFEVSPRIERTLVPGTEKLEAFHTDSCAADLDASGIPKLSGSTSIEVLALLEKDENIEKAEAYMNKLDDMCNMLRKKHDDARELLVRAIVNNNSVLKLNHPLFDEKIRSLQQFATSLQSKHFF